MANYRAIAATGASLAGLIRDRYPRDEFGSGLDVLLYQTSDFESPMTDGFSVYLYRVGVNATIRNRPPRRGPGGERYRPSLPVDLYFMITPWAQDVERQLRMLGWVMRLMEDTGVLSAGHLNHYLQENDTFAPHEAVELINDPLPLGDYLTLWDRLRHRLPASATFTLRMVSIDSDVLLGDGPSVQTRRFDMAVVEDAG
ncbi:MAG TPA: DUF4255 domain-containing protein [Longimicrobium sp.]|nr:DUF4255 domain-containing protein [Longimicrobium sp.]